MLIELCYQEFLDNLISEKNVSNSTITSYETDFKVLKSFLVKNNIRPLLDNITTPILRRYISFLKVDKGIPLEEKSILYLHSISIFWNRNILIKILCYRFMLQEKNKNYLFT